MLQKDEDYSQLEDPKSIEQEFEVEQETSTNLDFQDVLSEENGCFTDEEARAYLEYTSPSLQLVTTYNYVDFEDIENPFKQ